MKIQIILTFILSLILTSCSLKGNTGKVKKDIEIEEVKRDGLTVVSETVESAPSIDFVKE